MEGQKRWTKLNHYLAGPFIWLPLVSIVFLDICIELYHHTSFPLYQIPLVSRKSYVKLDRYKLPYLSGADKVFCLYCEYANGVLRYCAAIAGETEKYWCGIRHEEWDWYIEPAYQRSFISYNDSVAYEAVCKLENTPRNPKNYKSPEDSRFLS